MNCTRETVAPRSGTAKLKYRTGRRCYACASTWRLSRFGVWRRYLLRFLAKRRFATTACCRSTAHSAIGVVGRRIPASCWHLASCDSSFARLFESPCVPTRLSCYGLDHRRPSAHVRFTLSSAGCYIGVPDELLYRGTVQDPEVLVRFGLERWRLAYSFQMIIERGYVVPRLTWYGS